jgi:hypothetical protein
MRRRCSQRFSLTSPPPWQAFIEGVVYADANGRVLSETPQVAVFQRDRLCLGGRQHPYGLCQSVQHLTRCAT